MGSWSTVHNADRSLSYIDATPLWRLTQSVTFPTDTQVVAIGILGSTTFPVDVFTVGGVSVLPAEVTASDGSGGGIQAYRLVRGSGTVDVVIEDTSGKSFRLFIAAWVDANGAPTWVGNGSGNAGWYATTDVTITTTAGDTMIAFAGGTVADLALDEGTEVVAPTLTQGEYYGVATNTAVGASTNIGWSQGGPPHRITSVGMAWTPAVGGATGDLTEGADVGDAWAATSLGVAATEGADIGDSFTAQRSRSAAVSEGIAAGMSLGTAVTTDWPAMGAAVGDSFAALAQRAATMPAGGAVVGDAFTAVVTSGQQLAEGAVAGDTLTVLRARAATVVDTAVAGLTLAAQSTRRASQAQGATVGLSATAQRSRATAAAEGAVVGDSFVGTVSTPTIPPTTTALTLTLRQQHDLDMELN